MLDLQLATNEQLCSELRRRYWACVILGARRENIEEQDVVMEGPSYMVDGLLHQALHGFTAHAVDGDDE